MATAALDEWSSVVAVTDGNGTAVEDAPPVVLLLGLLMTDWNLRGMRLLVTFISYESNENTESVLLPSSSSF